MNANQHLGFASVPAVNQYLRFAADSGLDCGRALAAAGVDPVILQGGQNQRINGDQFQSLLRDLAQQAQDPLLGLKSGNYVQPGSYSVLGYIVMSCSTLREAVERIIPFEKLVGDMGVTSLTQEGARTLIRWDCAYPDPDVRPHMIANVLASWVNFARWLANADSAAPLQVLFEHPSPGPEFEPVYQRAFQCEVIFDSPVSGLVVNDALLDTPLRQPDLLLRQTLESHASAQIKTLDEEDLSLLTRVKNTIRHQLRHGVSRQDMVAERLGVTARTLQRRLSEYHSSYQLLLDEVRLEMAQDMLTHSDVPIPDIARQLGFAEVRSFHRSFKNHTGVTPGEFRDNAGAPT
ncbi:AraC-type DNA-binding domain-containing protein [Hahella chejuensis KCTC 2396]|uniref:AraC-type DNA-binding domain-containing protein n=1 Tax=Hahella chejuensis (strain KCTC 2396) TaxID=349521 RepID=Q2SDE8_HAHCH|nr:AraC family transcriptional regulator [Hahella chejuensis]ABC31326.1 AraC-type DNA-binding domain-containing protein [Hahella chejuensis KCTC 2396]